MIGEFEQGLHLRLFAVELLEGGLELGGDVADELSLEGVALIGQTDGLLLLAVEEDKAHQHDGSDDQSGCQSGCEDAEPDDEEPARGQRTVFISDGSFVICYLFFQGTDLVGMLQCIGGILPSEVVTIRLGHHVGIIALATIGDECLVHFVNFVVFLAGRQFVGHLLEHGIALGIHAKGIVIDGLRV